MALQNPCQASPLITTQPPTTNKAIKHHPRSRCYRSEVRNRKRKCSRDFPCTDCRKDGIECVPRIIRKARKAKPREPEQDAEGVEDDAQQLGEQPENRAVKKKRKWYDPNKKYMQNMPPVMGGYQEWSNMRLKYNPIPEDVDAVREKLFKLEKPVLLTSQQYADYWPHISNMYVRSKAQVIEDNFTAWEDWECRNQRRVTIHNRKGDRYTEGESKRNRESKRHLLEATEPCRIRFCLVMYLKHAATEEDHKTALGSCRCVPEWLYCERTPRVVGLDHNHTLESMDRFKRSDGVTFYSRQKVEEGGYMYATVLRWMKDKLGGKTNQIQFLSDSDVANASRQWRVQNRDLALIDEILEPSAEEEAKQKCLELINVVSASADTNAALRTALVEVCRQIPAAVDIALSLLEKSAPQDWAKNAESSEILEGSDIKVPHPGFPMRLLEGKLLNGYAAQNNAKVDNGARAHNAAMCISNMPHATAARTFPMVRADGADKSLAAEGQQQGIVENRIPSTPTAPQQQNAPYASHYNEHTQGHAPQKSPYPYCTTTRPMQPSSPSPPPPQHYTPYGPSRVDNARHRAPVASRSPQAEINSTTTTAVRPSWARPEAIPIEQADTDEGKRGVESKRAGNVPSGSNNERVQKQLEAELAA
ncbi:hypothetical protein LTR37_017450 [Vermiconidia calcicola]|uniref:Uncharacterized protein n=1 Tax=Vermiconidia calcicola TaxID=1690605 RepID=A0ACC3MJS4_9PEZI|nr:hypothetical protein LTR37_017450 [Vermiconidia calcicola]